MPAPAGWLREEGSRRCWDAWRAGTPSLAASLIMTWQWHAPWLHAASIKGAGHMVPENKPDQALAMFKRFVNGESL